jgi:hypothetical protein
VAFYRSQAPRHFVVWSECWPSVELFCACNTQWRIKPMGGVQGLDYSAVRAVLEMRGVLDKGALFDDVRLMEFGALAALNGKTLDELIYG